MNDERIKTVSKSEKLAPFCLCKLKGQKLTIRLRNPDDRIQHAQIVLKSQVPNFRAITPNPQNCP